MVHIPNEICHLICSELESDQSKATLKNFRLASKGFATIAREHLFRVVHVCVKQSSLHHLTSLSQCDEISGYVRHLRCSTDSISSLDGVLWNLLSTDEAKQMGLHHEQLELLYSRKLVSTIANAVKRFPALQTVTIDTELDYARPDPHSTYGGFEEFGTAFAHAILPNLHDKAKLLDFKYNCVNHFFFREEIATIRVQNVLAALTHLSLCAKDFSGPETDDQFYDGHIRAFLRCAKRLVSLRIDLDQWFLSDETTLEDVFGDSHWPDLQSIDLGGVELEKEHTLDFFQRHSKSLRNVTIRVVQDTDGLYSELFQEISSNIHLDSIAVLGPLRRYWDSYKFQDMEKDAAVDYEDTETKSRTRISLGRMLRYLICGQKTDNFGRCDILYDAPEAFWNKITWTFISDHFLF